jgi:hypothetical protein
LYCFSSDLKCSGKRLYFVVTAVTSLSVRTPYNCPYCSQRSMRKENVSKHIQRKHPDKYNPFPQMKLKQSDCNFSQPRNPEPSNFNSPQHESSNFLAPRYDLSGSTQFIENSRKFQNVLQEISQWDYFELVCLLNAICNLRNFIR